MATQKARALVVPFAVALAMTGCGDSAGQSGTPTSSPAGDRGASLNIGDDELVVATSDGRIVRISESGKRISVLGRVPDGPGEVDSVDVSPDGRDILVSVVNDHDEACEVAVLRVQAIGSLQRLAEGGAASFSPDGTQLAYMRYTQDGEFCPRTHLAVRSLAEGTEQVVKLPGGSRVEGTPPDWPLNWSPDGTRLTYVSANSGAVVVTVGEWEARTLDGRPVNPTPSFAGAGPLNPIFLDDHHVAGDSDCCTGDGQMTSFSLDGRPSASLFTVPGPVRSIRNDRGGDGLWLTIEEAGLWHWDGNQLSRVPGIDALVTSG